MSQREIDEYNLFRRKNAIGEYTYNNRLDTIFVFQLTFIALLVFLILNYLATYDYISNGAKWITITTITVFVIYVYINRIVLYGKMRNKNNWGDMNYGDNTILPDGYVEAGTIGGTNGTAPPYVCVPHDAVTCPA